MGRSFTHLHLHTEFSMLDGAARVAEVVAAAAADGQPAIGITDHGNMYGVLDFYAECRQPGHQARHRHRGLHGRREPPRAAPAPGPDRRHGRRRRRRREALLPPHPAGRDRRRLPEPHQALEPGLPRGLLLQAPARLGAARAEHHEGSSPPPAAWAASCSSRCSRGDVAGATEKAARLQDIFGRDNLFVELQDHGLGRAAPHQPPAARDRPPHRGAAARHQRQPLHPPRGRRRPRRPAVRADGQHHRRPEPLQVRRRRALPEVGGRDAAPVRRGARGVRQHAVDRRAGRRRDRVRQAAAARVPAARGLRPDGRRRPTCRHLGT